MSLARRVAARRPDAATQLDESRHARTRLRPLSIQRAAIVRVLLFVYLPAGLLLLGLAVLSAATPVGFDELSRDPVAVLDGPFYVGLLSNAGLALWAAAAAVALLAAAAVRDAPHRRELAGLLAWTAALTLFLLADDALLLHERIVPRHLGLSSAAVPALQAGLLAALLLRYRRVVLAGDYALLLLALAAFGAAVGVDKLQDWGLLEGLGVASRGLAFLLEDGCKFLGIVGWLAWLVRTSLEALRVDAAPPP